MSRSPCAVTGETDAAENNAQLKPLKSILKKRKPDPKREPKSENEHQPAEVKKPKGGSITEALKMLSAIKSGSDDEEDESDPKPSAFILEMEKQQKQHATFIPVHLNVHKNSVLNVMPTTEEEIFEEVVLITNLPFKVSKDDLIKTIGFWPKGGLNGIRLVTDSSGLPAGCAYVVVERHKDLMDLLRLSGVVFEGRKMRCTKSGRQNLIDDWKVTKRALAEIEKSRVIRIKQIPFTLEKSSLVSTFKEFQFTEEDIYWSPIKENQTNSGRAFVVLSSSEDAKKALQSKYLIEGRTLEVTQAHPNNLKKFADQFKLNLAENIVFLDDIPEDANNTDDLDLNPKISDNDKPDVKVINKSTSQSVSQKSMPFSSKKPQVMVGLPSNNWIRPPGAPTVFVRMYNVPEKATNTDVKQFFEPISPAKIAQNIGYNIWDIEFYNPGEAISAMGRHGLMMRRNVIHLQMMPGPAHPLPPRHSLVFSMPFSSRTTSMMLQPPGPFMPPGVPHQIMGPQPMPMGMPQPYVQGIRPPLLPQRTSDNLSHTPEHSHKRDLPSAAQINPRSMPPPMGRNYSPGRESKLDRFDRRGRDYNERKESNRYDHRERARERLYRSTSPLRRERRHRSTSPRRRHVSPSRQKTVEETSQRQHGSPSPRQHCVSPPKLGSMREVKQRRHKSQSLEQHMLPPKRELIPVPPLPIDFTKYKLPLYNADTPVGQGAIITMQGFFCQLCSKFYNSLASARNSHCRSKGHYDKLKQVIQEKKRLRKMAEVECNVSKKAKR